MSHKLITYFAFAQNKKDQIEQLRVVRPIGFPFIQTWTGKIYATIKDAEKDMIELNCR